MVRRTSIPLEDVIEWDFVAAEQNNAVRYGTSWLLHYKQFLPGGIVIPALHPPKVIPKAIYEHAKKIAKA